MKISKFRHNVLSSQKSIAFTIVGLFILIGLGTLILSHADATTALLSLSPTSQTVTTGSDVTITLDVNPEGNSVNTVQTVLSYPSANFTLVSAVAGSDFGSFIDTPASGSLGITAASTTAVTSSSAITVATITLAAKAAGTNLTTSLANVCSSGNYAVTCSAVYDSVNSANDLASVGGSASYTVNALPPSAPTNFTSGVKTSTSAALSWTASADSGTLGGYNLYRYVTGAGATTATKVATIAASSTSYTNTGLSPGTGYSYFLEAYDTSVPVGVSAPSSTIAVTTIALPTTPTNLTKTASTTTSISLSWTASTDTGGPGLGGYYLYRYVTSAGASTATKIANIATTTYIDAGLSVGTGYSYYVESYDISTNTIASNVSAASTTLNTSTASLILPSTPTGLAKVSSSAYTVSLSWTASTDTGGPGIGGYYLYRNSTKIASLSATTTSYIDTGLTINTNYSYSLEAYDTASTPNVSATSATLIAPTSDIIGDLDGDNLVTGHDVSIILSYYGKAYVPAEFDGGSLVEGHDVSMLLTNYGK